MNTPSYQYGQPGDSFVEQLVVKKHTPVDLVAMIALWSVGILVAVVLVAVGMIGRGFFDPESSTYALLSLISPFLMMAGIGAGWLTWWLAGRFHVEYEYTITNGELDVDKIMARRKRTRLITVKLSTVENGGKVDSAALNGHYDAQIFAVADQNDPENRFLVFRHPKTGNTLLVFSPNSRTLTHMRHSVPRILHSKVFAE